MASRHASERSELLMLLLLALLLALLRLRSHGAKGRRGILIFHSFGNGLWLSEVEERSRAV